MDCSQDDEPANAPNGVLFLTARFAARTGLGVPLTLVPRFALRIVPGQPQFGPGIATLHCFIAPGLAQGIALETAQVLLTLLLAFSGLLLIGPEIALAIVLRHVSALPCRV